jgi:hypothetical protein
VEKEIISSEQTSGAAIKVVVAGETGAVHKWLAARRSYCTVRTASASPLHAYAMAMHSCGIQTHVISLKLCGI